MSFADNPIAQRRAVPIGQRTAEQRAEDKAHWANVHRKGDRNGAVETGSRYIAPGAARRFGLSYWRGSRPRFDTGCTDYV